MNLGGGGVFVGLVLRRRLERGSGGDAPTGIGGAPVLPEEVQMAVFSAAMRAIWRAVIADNSRRLAWILLASPLVLVGSPLVFPLSSLWRSIVHSPRNFFPLKKTTRCPFQ